MADKPVSLEDLARAEAQALEAREVQKKAYLEGQKRLLQEVPQLFFRMALQLREGADRFNGAAKLQTLVKYQESAAVTTRETNPNADYVVELERQQNVLTMLIRNMGRVGRPDSLVIDAFGAVGIEPKRDRFNLRIEGQVKGGELNWRITCDYQPVDTPIDELPDRMVALIATGEMTRLWKIPPFASKMNFLTTR